MPIKLRGRKAANCQALMDLAITDMLHTLRATGRYLRCGLMKIHGERWAFFEERESEGGIWLYGRLSVAHNADLGWQIVARVHGRDGVTCSCGLPAQVVIGCQHIDALAAAGLLGATRAGKEGGDA